MAITINVTGTQSGGGGGAGLTPPPGNNGGVNPTPPNGKPYTYERPNFDDYSPSVVNRTLPTSDMLVQDIRREMTTRGVFLVPGTNNFSTLMNQLRNQERSSVMGAIEGNYNNTLSDISTRKTALLAEIQARINRARQSELSGATTQADIDDINKRYDRLTGWERERVDSFYKIDEDRARGKRDDELVEADARLTAAINQLVEELSTGNKDSYLNKLRDEYRQQIWRRDNADTEEEVREASREASKIQERMQRAMNGGAFSPFMARTIQAGASIAMIGLNGLSNYWRQSDDMTWNLGIEQASAVLSGNAFNAIRQRNQREIAMAENIGSTLGGMAGAGLGWLGGTALGGAIGSSAGPLGTAIGMVIGAIGGAIGAWGGNQLAYLYNRPNLRENAMIGASELWRQEEQRMMQFNDLAMLTRGGITDVDKVRNFYMLGGKLTNPTLGPPDVSGAWDKLKKQVDNLTGGSVVDAVEQRMLEEGVAKELLQNGWNVIDAATPGTLRSASGLLNTLSVFDVNSKGLNLYDLGYTAPEFSKMAAGRIKQRGMVSSDAVVNALYSDALERVFSMNSGAISQLSQYDRFGNNAIQDFANLAVTLDRLGTTGMSSGAWARSDEFAGYMGQLQSSQRSTFLTVNNARAARQIATGQAVFGNKFGAEALQGIQAINNQVQNPGGGFAKTLLYDIIQEKWPDTRGDLRKIRLKMYDPNAQDYIQREFARRMAAIYGGPDTIGGFLAYEEATGIHNPIVLDQLNHQMVKGGGLEATKLSGASIASLTQPLKGYTPSVTKGLNASADSQMTDLVHYSKSLVEIAENLLQVVREDTTKTLAEAINALHDLSR